MRQRLLQGTCRRLCQSSLSFSYLQGARYEGLVHGENEKVLKHLDFTSYGQTSPDCISSSDSHTLHLSLLCSRVFQSYLIAC